MRSGKIIVTRILLEVKTYLIKENVFICPFSPTSNCGGIVSSLIDDTK